MTKAKAGPGIAARRLKALRERTGLTVRATAEAIEREFSTYAYYEDSFKREFLPPDLIRALLPVFEARGIAREEVLALGGLTETPRISERKRSSNPKTIAPPSEQSTVAFDASMVTVKELDVRPAAGHGPGALEVWRDREDEATVGTYGFPSAGFRQVYGAPPERVRIIEVIGDSMAPALSPGQKVMVDASDLVPSPPGIFVVWDGLGHVIKRVEFIAHSDPAAVRITSDNPQYPPYERPLGEAYIEGRVIGQWKRL